MAQKGEAKELPLAKQQDLFETRETWCAVEKMKEEAWLRKNRRHYGHHLESHLFEEGGVSEEPRCTFQVNAPTHRERKHFNRRHLISQWDVL